MTVYRIDPLVDERWNDLVQRHSDASVFHSAEWMQALKQTYGYEPFALTTSASGNCLSNAIPFCEVSSWFGKRRLVSLPFSDHCTPLVENQEQVSYLLDYLGENQEGESWDRIEIRATTSAPSEADFGDGTEFLLHKLDLRPSLDEILKNFHRDCVQRKIHRAERGGLTHEVGRSEGLLGKFYHLLLKTRRRHGVPPQPLKWFHNLIACLGDKLQIRVASKDDVPVAGILTLRHKKSLVYKYGCSDTRFNHLGGMQMLFWQMIQDAKNDQLVELDLGRSDCNNPGLVAFKDRWGAKKSKLVYWQYPPSADSVPQGSFSKRVFASMPDSLLAASGRVLYRYMG